MEDESLYGTRKIIKGIDDVSLEQELEMLMEINPSTCLLVSYENLSEPETPLSPRSPDASPISPISPMFVDLVTPIFIDLTTPVFMED